MKFDNSTIRRQDRTLEQERAFEILKEGEFGILSMRAEDGNGAYGIPLSYVWGPGELHLHSLRARRTEAEMHRCLPASFLLRDRAD